jgi:hypothetical protein
LRSEKLERQATLQGLFDSVVDGLTTGAIHPTTDTSKGIYHFFWYRWAYRLLKALATCLGYAYSIRGRQKRSRRHRYLKDPRHSRFMTGKASRPKKS